MTQRIDRRKFLCVLVSASTSIVALLSAAMADDPRPAANVLTGREALGDWTTDAPGVRRRLTLDDLPKPFDTGSANNFPKVVRRPAGAMPRAPKGFQVSEFATGLRNPRKIVTASNGDVFVAESYPNRIKVLRDADGDGKAELNEVFATGLTLPFGIAFYPSGAEPTYVYVGNTNSVVRIAYQIGDTKARSPAEVIIKGIPSGREQVGGGGHWTRDLAFSKDGKTLFVSVGSRSNVSDDQSEKRRADILAFDPDGKNERIYASGIRNAVGLAIHPETGQLWASVNERDALGDHLVPDYVTHVQEGGFYGWPWFYLGSHQDPRHKDKHPELKDKVIVPDVLVQSHSASLCMTFYTGEQYPPEYRLDAFAAEHGSWNRARRTGYKVIRVPLKNGKATSEYEDFLVGFVTPDGNVWGRPVGVTVAKDGALLVSDDGSGTIWRVAYTGSIERVGKRVVQKVRDFALRVDDEDVERSRKAIDFYQVERTDGPSLWLKAQRQGVTGWAPADKVVPVEQAIEFFTQQIRARPQDAFPYAMRAFLRHDNNQLDLALRDYDQAVRLDPQDARTYCGRGSARQSNKEYDKAAADFDRALRFDPKNTHAYIGRGISRATKREYTMAIADFSEAIWLDPLSVAGYYNRGLAWQSKREYQKAVVDYNLAIRLDPQQAHAHCQRGRAWAAQKKYDKAIADFSEAFRLDPQYAGAYSSLAWLLATCPDAKVRDGDKAVAPATKACELTGWIERACLDTLAAACAAAGDFESAVKWQTKANTLASGAEDTAMGEGRIKLYREKKLYLETNP